MFETSVVAATAVPSRGKYTVLTVSLIAHSAVIVGAIAMGLASVSFPISAPDEFEMIRVSAPPTIPPPLGNPNGGAQQKPAQPPQQKQQPAPPPTQITAPPAVPENVTPADAPSTGNTEATTPGTGGTVPGPIGVPWGTDGSTGPLDAPPAPMPQAPVENKVYTEGEVKAPVIIKRVEPAYPPALARAGARGKVAVHCIIDKNGHVRDMQVVFATMPAFADSVLRAMKEWRYQPASLNGQAVDCYLDLSVDFGVIR